jgi:hypothetical protein
MLLGIPFALRYNSPLPVSQLLYDVVGAFAVRKILFIAVDDGECVISSRLRRDLSSRAGRPDRIFRRRTSNRP